MSTPNVPTFIKPAKTDYTDKLGRHYTKRHGSQSKQDREVIDAVVTKNLGNVSPKEVKALARKLDHTLPTMKKWVRDAKQKFLANASRYVEIHRQAVEAALASGDQDAKYLEVATRGSQWAIERLSAEGERVVEQQKTEEGSGVKVMIGVKVGSLNESAQ